MKYIRRENPWWRASKLPFSQSWHALSTSSSTFTNEIRPTRKPLTKPLLHWGSAHLVIDYQLWFSAFTNEIHPREKSLVTNLWTQAQHFWS
jgi:hypothetical protein